MFDPELVEAALGVLGIVLLGEVDGLHSLGDFPRIGGSHQSGPLHRGPTSLWSTIFDDKFAVDDKERLFVGTVADCEGIKRVAPGLSGVGDNQVILKLIVRRPDADQAQSGIGRQGVETAADLANFPFRETIAVQLA